MIRRIISLFTELYNRSSEVKYINYLRKKGVKIGQNTSILSPNHSLIDTGRASWIEIGDNCILTHGVSLIAHDYSWSILRKSHNIMAPTGGGIIKIGNNVFIGVNSIVLRNVTIGDNCIIGVGSVVCSSIPANSVAAGNPCKVIMSLDEFCEKRKKNILKEASLEALHIMKVKGRMPTEMEMRRWGFLYNTKNPEIINKLTALGDDREEFVKSYLSQEAVFDNYDSFLKYVKENNTNENNPL